MNNNLAEAIIIVIIILVYLLMGLYTLSIIYNHLQRFREQQIQTYKAFDSRLARFITDENFKQIFAPFMLIWPTLLLFILGFFLGTSIYRNIICHKDTEKILSSYFCE